MNASPADPKMIRLNLPRPGTAPAANIGPGRAGEWSLRRWMLLIALVFIAHVAAIFIFGGYKFPPVRVAKNVPRLQIADNAGQFMALDDPTLFALPHAGDFALLTKPKVNPPAFRWTEAPRWLPLASENLGATFTQFMRTNSFGGYQMNFKPPPKSSAPEFSFQPAFPKTSTLQIASDLAQRQLLDEIVLPDWPYADVIAPSKVQVLVDAAGNVVSAVLLPSNNPSKGESHYAAADERALEIARAARFSPAPRLTVGTMIFNWCTVPPPATNSIDGS